MRAVVLEKLSVICVTAFTVSTATAGTGALVLGGAAVALAVPALWSSFSTWKDCPQKVAITNAAKAAEKALAEFIRSGEIPPDAQRPAEAALETVVEQIVLEIKTIRKERWNMSRIPYALLDAVAEISEAFNETSSDPQVEVNRTLFLFTAEATIKALTALNDFEKTIMPAFRADAFDQLDRIELLLKLLHEQFKNRIQEMGINLRDAQDAVIRSEANLEQAKAFLELILNKEIAPDQFSKAFIEATARWFSNNPNLNMPLCSNLAPEADDLRQQAKEAWDANRIDHFYKIRKQISAANARARERLAEQKREIEEQQAFHREIEIKDLQEEADAAASVLNAEGVADAITRKVKLEVSDPGHWFEQLLVIHGQWYERGRNKGLNFDLEVSIALAREARGIAAGFDQVGAALHNLGDALSILGGRENGPKRLEEAVKAQREALDEWTRDRVPLQWATVQNNLGTALRALGERESGTALLEEAVKVYHSVLDVRTQDSDPLEWAMTQNNLGNTLKLIGDRESGTKRLEEAVTAYRAALKERTRNRVPLSWAITQNNLGTALRALGERESGTKRLEEAVTAYRQALEERTRDRVPLSWAITQNNLGNALRALGERESGTKRLKEAATAYHEALEEWTRDRNPLNWAIAMENRIHVFKAFYEKTGEQSWLVTAIAHARAALKVYREAKADYYIDSCERLLADLKGIKD